MSALALADFLGMLVTFAMVWPTRDEIIVSVALLFGLETEEEIARSAAGLVIMSVLMWPWTLSQLLQDQWPDP